MVVNVADVLSAYRQPSVAGGKINASAEPGGASFGDMLKDFTTDVIKTTHEGEKAAAAGTAGKADLQSVVLAVEKASTMLETVVAIRDKIVSAYQEILRMPV